MKRPAKRSSTAVAALDDEPLIKGEMDGGDAVEGDGEEDDDDEDEDDEDEDDEDMGKSLPSEQDLIKSMNDLASAADVLENGGSLRKSELASRLAAGEELTKAETNELKALIDGDDGEGEPLQKSFKEQLIDDPAIKGVVEVSEFLDAQTSALCKGLDDIRAAHREGNAEVRGMVGKLAKGIHAVGMNQLTLSKRLAKLEGLTKSDIDHRGSQPVEAKGNTRVGQRFSGDGAPLNKSNNGGGQKPPLTKQDIGDTIQELIKSTESAGATGFGIVEGVDLVTSQARFEQTGKVDPSTLRLVVKKRGLDPASLGL